MSDDLNLLEIFWNVLPPVAIYNIIKRTSEHGSNDVQYTAVGWQPDESYQEVKGVTASGEKEYTKKASK